MNIDVINSAPFFETNPPSYLEIEWGEKQIIKLPKALDHEAHLISTIIAEDIAGII